MNGKKARKIRKICEKMNKYPDETEYLHETPPKGIHTVILSPSCGRFYYKQLKRKLS